MAEYTFDEFIHSTNVNDWYPKSMVIKANILDNDAVIAYYNEARWQNEKVFMKHFINKIELLSNMEIDKIWNAFNNAIVYDGFFSYFVTLILLLSTDSGRRITVADIRNNFTPATKERYITSVNNNLFDEVLLDKLAESGISNNLKDWKVEYSLADEDIIPKPTKKEMIEDFLLPKMIKNSIKSSSKKQIVFTGAPGTGKTYSVEEYVKIVTRRNKERYHFVQFHSSFDYTDFVEGLRPIKGEDGSMQFVRMDGIFKAFCRKAVGDPNHKFYFIIDEINRADLGRVFGELMYCFEKRGKEHSVQTQYSNLPTYVFDDVKGERKYIFGDDDEFGEGFYIPENVVVLGTMNDIDRSVETFDFALRRRFDWVEIDADEVMENALIAMRNKGEIDKSLTDEEIQALINDKIKPMNGIIASDTYNLGNAFKIGPAYFKDYNGDNLQDIWNRSIKPILREYVRGRRTENTDDFLRDCAGALKVEVNNGNG